MKRIEVALGDRGYPVLISAGLLENAGTHLGSYARRNRLIVVSDDNVWAALGSRFCAALEKAGIEAFPIVLTPGEGSKDMGGLAALLGRLLALGVERDDHIVALGGGVIGDLTGFAAAIVKRGCSYVQIPTTLLAQVDSSVGGKTAINVPAGKNLVGAFHQPAAVLIDPETLATLPERHRRAGYAEVAKYGLIGDADFFAWCEKEGAAALLRGDSAALLHAIETSIRAKAAIVAEDERETAGRRALLNLGHTFAHALEKETGYSDRLIHGEAVAVGIVLAFRFSAGRGLCAAADVERVTAHFHSVGLPATMEEAGISADGQALAAHMAHDKKSSGGKLPFILVRGIGGAFVDWSVKMEDVAGFLDRERALA